MQYALFWCIGPLLGLLTGVQPAAGFALLTHQAVVDSCWARAVVPALERSYPGASAAQLREARSYAYGGAMLHDLGYFPGSAVLFSDLTHYVRPGDFVRALQEEAHDRNELAFALGALAHYVADAYGHPEAANAVTSLVFPELNSPLGSLVTYAEAPDQHSQIEFAFDVAQLEAGYYRSEEFHEAIGTRVSRQALERAFQRTYGLPLAKVLPRVGPSLAVYRLFANQLLPAAARASLYLPSHQVRQLSPTERRDYYARINTGRFRRRTRAQANRLSLGMHALVAVVHTLPRCGVASLLAFRPLSPAALATMRCGFGEALANYQTALADLNAPLPNLNLDTGQPIHVADYPLADSTYAVWRRLLAQTTRKAGFWATVRQDLQRLFHRGDDKAGYHEISGSARNRHQPEPR
ncbi:zinc dependent phospholipase C family protein [Hymenobacter terrenus]|uniref:zinc dependent phospholipase C family protein n=1 Tax=Hymenobacter terrenus TaxID=1629124 RepID=UPI0006990DA9|nr:zinc dependent phospholipase C family protein [Hymenobacter terrenus]